MTQNMLITVLIIVVFLFLQDITLRISKAIVAWLDAKNIVEMMESKYKLDAIIWKKIMKDIEIVKRTKIYNVIKTIPIVNIFYSFYYYKVVIKKIKSHYLMKSYPGNQMVFKKDFMIYWTLQRNWNLMLKIRRYQWVLFIHCLRYGNLVLMLNQLRLTMKMIGIMMLMREYLKEPMCQCSNIN